MFTFLSLQGSEDNIKQRVSMYGPIIYGKFSFSRAVFTEVIVRFLNSWFAEQ
jgi:hypothetical protein